MSGTSTWLLRVAHGEEGWTGSGSLFGTSVDGKRKTTYTSGGGTTLSGQPERPTGTGNHLATVRVGSYTPVVTTLYRNPPIKTLPIPRGARSRLFVPCCDVELWTIAMRSVNCFVL